MVSLQVLDEMEPVGRAACPARRRLILRGRYSTLMAYCLRQSAPPGRVR